MNQEVARVVGHLGAHPQVAVNLTLNPNLQNRIPNLKSLNQLANQTLFNKNLQSQRQSLLTRKMTHHLAKTARNLTLQIPTVILNLIEAQAVPAMNLGQIKSLTATPTKAAHIASQKLLNLMKSCRKRKNQRKRQKRPTKVQMWLLSTGT